MTSSDSQPDGARKFVEWRAKRRLPASFPALDPLADFELQDKVVLAEAYKEKIDSALDGDFSIIGVSRGHGCTTLRDYFFVVECSGRSARKSKRVAVKVDAPPSLISSTPMAEWLDFQIVKGIILALVDDNSEWERVKEDPYRELLNAWEFELEEMHLRKSELRRIVRNIVGPDQAWYELLEQELPALNIYGQSDRASALENVLASVHRLSGARVLLMIDLSGEVPQDYTDFVMGYAKDALSRPSEDARMCVAMFCHRLLAQSLYALPLAARPEVIAVPPLSPDDIFEILGQRYIPGHDNEGHDHSSAAHAHLEHCFDPRIVDLVYDENKSLREMLEAVQSVSESILEKKPTRPWKLWASDAHID